MKSIFPQIPKTSEKNQDSSSNDLDQSEYSTCPRCGKKACDRQTNSYFCFSCIKMFDIKVCLSCGTENIGGFHCCNCGQQLASLGDITSNTHLIEESETLPICLKLNTIEEEIPPMPSKKTLDTYQLMRRSGHKKLTGADRFAFHKNLNKSYPEGAFDPNRFFEAFDKLRLKEGYFLDYILSIDDELFISGGPKIFARKFGSMPLISLSDKGAEEIQGVCNVLEYEKSIPGLFQLATFISVYDNFYLFAHSNYNDTRPVLSKKYLDELIEEFSEDLEPAGIERLKQLDIRPRVVLHDCDNGHVTIIHFNMHHGFSWIRSIINSGKVTEKLDEMVSDIRRRCFF